MSYMKAEQVLPKDVIEIIQQYVDGNCIYIPRKEHERKAWGESTKIRTQLQERDQQIYLDYQDGLSTSELADKYFLSQKSIQRIISCQKKKTA